MELRWFQGSAARGVFEERTCSPSRVAQVWGEGENAAPPTAVQADALGTAAMTARTKETNERCKEGSRARVRGDDNKEFCESFVHALLA